MDILRKSESRDEFAARQKWIADDRASFNSIARLGTVGGLTATLAAGILDPLSVGISIATGGLGTAARTANFASKSSTFLKAGAAVAAENTAIEAYLRSNSSQKSEYSLLAAAAGGFLLGGVAGTAYRNKRFKQVSEMEQVEAAIAIEAEKRASHIRDVALGKVGIQDVAYDRSGINIWKGDAIEEIKSNRRGELLNRNQRKTLESEISTNEGLLKPLKDRLSNLNTKTSGNIRALKGAVTRTEKNILTQAQEKAIRNEIDWRLNNKGRGTHLNEAFKGVTTTRLKSRVTKSDSGKASRKKYRTALSADKLKARVATSEARIADMKKQLADADNFARSTDDIASIRKMSDEDVIAKIKEKNPDYVPYRLKEQEDLAKENRQTWANITRSEGGESSTTRPSTGRSEVSEVSDELDGVPDKVAGKIQELTEVANRHVNDYTDIRFLGPFAPVANRMIHSMSAPLRGLSRVAFDFGQGGSSARTVDSSIDIHRAKMEANLGGSFQYGFDQWKIENGYGRLQGIFKGDIEKQYHRLVIKQISRPDANAPESIKVAAEGWKRMSDYGFDNSVKSGEVGFTEGKRLPNYFTTLMNDKAIVSYVNDARVGREVVEEVLAQGYANGAHSLPIKKARFIARYVVDGQINKYHTGSGSTSRNVRVEPDVIRDLLRTNGVSDRVADDFIAGIEEDLSLASMSNRAKASLGADLSTEVTLPNGDKFGMIDMIEDDISKVANGYINDRAGGIAWAQAGFKSRHELNEYLTQAERLGTKAYPEKIKQIKEEVETMRQAIGAQFGEILPDDLKGDLRSISRRTRQFSSLMVGGRLGLSAMPDLYRAIVNHGIKNTITASKELNLFTNPDFAKAMTTGNAWKNPAWKELNFLVGYRGFDDKLQALTRSLDLEEGVSEGFGAMVDAGLKKGIRVNNLLSGLRQVQRGIDQLSIRSSYMDLSKRLINNNPTDYHLNMMGWDRPTWDRMSELAQKHAGEVEYEGSRMRILNAEMMDGDAQELLGIAISRMHRRNTTRMSVGEAPLMANKEYGRFLLMFRQFTLGSVEKQLIHDVRGRWDAIR